MFLYLVCFGKCVPLLAVFQHVSLLSLVSILLKAKQNDDALTVANIALEVAPYLTAVHYAIANVYLAKVSQTCQFSFHFNDCLHVLL